MDSKTVSTPAAPVHVSTPCPWFIRLRPYKAYGLCFGDIMAHSIEDGLCKLHWWVDAIPTTADFIHLHWDLHYLWRRKDWTMTWLPSLNGLLYLLHEGKEDLCPVDVSLKIHEVHRLMDPDVWVERKHKEETKVLSPEARRKEEFCTILSEPSISVEALISQAKQFMTLSEFHEWCVVSGRVSLQDFFASYTKTELSLYGLNGMPDFDKYPKLTRLSWVDAEPDTVIHLFSNKRLASQLVFLDLHCTKPRTEETVCDWTKFPLFPHLKHLDLRHTFKELNQDFVKWVLLILSKQGVRLKFLDVAMIHEVILRPLEFAMNKHYFRPCSVVDLICNFVKV